jgi:ABC-type lipoprotein export system ATPase subunit
VAVSLERVTKRYGDACALADVSLSILAGELVSIVGTSGSGKTTLLNMVGGLDRAYEGSVRVFGRDLRVMRDNELSAFRNETIGFVFQHFHLLPHLTCVENVLLPSYFSHHGGAEALRHATEVLDKVGLSEKATVKPGNLSGGQKQRVAIARALLHRPRIILCDEPTGNLDRKTGEQILDIFARLNREDGITVFIITHEEHVARATRRTVRLEGGSVVPEGTTEGARLS